MKTLRAWCISDTHNKHMFLEIPDNVDIVIHSGDFGNQRNTSLNANEALNFLEWYKSLTHIRHKILISGNHDTSVEAGLIKRSDIHESITYLEHESCEIEGLKIWGSPYQPSFGSGWAYNVPRNKLEQYWNEIPLDTDILVTHGPPKGILDLSHQDMQFCGCKALLNKVNEVQPKYHVFGHIHEDGGRMLKIANHKTTFINASVLNLNYQLVNNGFIIDIETKN